MGIIKAVILEGRNLCQALACGSGICHSCPPRELELFIDQETGSEMSGDLPKGTERVRGGSGSHQVWAALALFPGSLTMEPHADQGWQPEGHMELLRAPATA